MANKYILGLFDDEDKLLKAIGNIRKQGVNITDVLTPFPIHGMEDAMGWKRSRIPTAGFIFGALGTLTALTLMIYIHKIDWPMDIGGKPYLALPSFIPITFELTVLFSAVGMVIVFFASCKLFPGASPVIYDDRITDDMFAMTFQISGSMAEADQKQITTLLEENGAVEIKEKEIS